MAENTWLYELYHRGRLLATQERQTFDQVWYVTIPCAPSFGTFKFDPQPDADQKQIDQLIQLGAERI